MVMNAVATDQPRGIRSSNHFGEAIITDLTTIMMDSRSVCRAVNTSLPHSSRGRPPSCGAPTRGREKLSNYLLIS